MSGLKGTSTNTGPPWKNKGKGGNGSQEEKVILHVREKEKMENGMGRAGVSVKQRRGEDKRIPEKTYTKRLPVKRIEKSKESLKSIYRYLKKVFKRKSNKTSGRGKDMQESGRNRCPAYG